MLNKQVILKTKPEFTPSLVNFEVVETEIPKLEDGDVLCETLYLSLDPYMRSQIAGRHPSGTVNPGDLMRGETISRVVDSRDAQFRPGDTVSCFGNWQTHSVHKGPELKKLDPRIDPPSYALSSLGMPGLTAYAAMIGIAKVKAGDVVLIPAATGAVGSTAGQIAKSLGATVVGIAGGAEKCAIATDTLGYQACIDRHSEDLAQKLAEYCPQGVDVYLDLVGGETLNTVCLNLAVGARVVLCGLMEDYNSPNRTPGPMPGPIIGARASLTGLVVYDWEDQRGEFLDLAVDLVAQGKLIVREDLTEGIEFAAEAFCRLMRGETSGKALVKLAD